MKFKGTIIITDPCYIMKEDSDWSKCNYGLNIEALGIYNYITETTIYGDWSCTTYSVENPLEVVNKIAEISKYFNNKLKEYGGYEEISDEEYKSLNEECEAEQDALNLKVEKLGNFCADAGLVSVFLLDEVLKYNPDFSKLIVERPWCVTTISDFDGDIEYYIDEVGDAHIIGIGSINFFTTQTAL